MSRKSRNESDCTTDSSAFPFNISRALKELSYMGVSLDMYSRCLAILGKVLGKDHVSIALPYNNKGMILGEKGDSCGALKAFPQCIAT